MVAVRCSSLPRASSGPLAARMKLVFISMVTQPMTGSTERAACAITTSSSVMLAPPCTTLNEFSCSSAGAKAISASPPSNFCSSKPSSSTKGM
jgi:hypothetical protein